MSDHSDNDNRRSRVDRRSGEERRRTYDLNYFLNGGLERRDPDGGDRRFRLDERRDGWVRISQWSSVYVGDGQFDATEPDLSSIDAHLEIKDDDSSSESGSTD